jgi:hypothetical protein
MSTYECSTFPITWAVESWISNRLLFIAEDEAGGAKFVGLLMSTASAEMAFEHGRALLTDQTSRS